MELYQLLAIYIVITTLFVVGIIAYWNNIKDLLYWITSPIRKKATPPLSRDNKRWTKEEIDYLGNKAKSMTAREIGKALGRTTQAIRGKASRLSIPLYGYKGK